MPVTSNVQIHVTTIGDVVIDEVINCAENTSSPGLVIVQAIPPNVFTPIYNPFTDLPSEYVITGVLILPPRNNQVGYSLTSATVQPVIPFHPSNPSFYSIMDMNVPLYISLGGSVPITFRFIWI